MAPFWLWAFGMCGLAGLLLAWPILRRNSDSVGEREAALAVLRDQLRELDRDLDAGRIGKEEARAARVEIERRALAADRLASATSASANWRVGLIIAAGIAAPTLAMLLYLELGQPRMALQGPSQPSPAQATAEGGAPGDMAARTEVMAKRLEAEGGDFEDWWLLGQSYVFLQQPGQAAQAFKKASELNTDPAVKAAYAEMLVQAAGGRVTPDAERTFNEVLEADPGDPRARYYKGLAAAQVQFFDDALQIWTELLDDSPPDAPWVNAVVQGIRDVAAAAGQDPETLLAGRGGAGQAEDLDALRAQLEASPKDYEGWIRLAEGEAARGNDQAARQAIASAREAYAGAPFVQQQLAQTEQSLGLVQQTARRGPTEEDVAAAQEMTADEQTEMIRSMVGGLAERLEANPDDLEGWLMLLRSYSVLGERENGNAAYERATAHYQGQPSALQALEQQARTAGFLQ